MKIDLNMFRRWCRIFTLAGVMAWAFAPARGADYPLLQQLDQQTRSLYQDVQAGLVRVQLPVPKWVREAEAQNDPLKKWEKKVDPKVREKIEAFRGAKGGPTRINATVLPSTRPSATQPGVAAPAGWKTSTNASGEIILESRGGGSSIVLHANDRNSPPPTGVGGPVRPRDIANGSFAPNNFGLLLDEEGHVLVPLYIERETLGNAPVRMMVADTEVSATYVGSDEKTNITILKMDKVVGRPVKMGLGRPAEGSLVMLLNPASGAGRLAIWTGGEKEYGVVVGMDGRVSGIVRFGQFLGGPGCDRVIEQLKKVGHIQRAILGARLTEVPSDSGLRRENMALADHPALLIEEITPNSLAERSGLRSGDFILQLGDEVVGDLTTWATLSAVGGATKVTVLRDGKRVEVPINLRPAE
jgi:hypothetical protein